MSDDDPKEAKEEFRGTVWGAELSGDFIINTTKALNGDVRIQLAEGRAFVIEVEGNPIFQVTSQGGKAKIDLGSGASERLMLGDAFMALFNELVAKINTHAHTGPTAPPAGAVGTPMTPDAHLAKKFMAGS